MLQILTLGRVAMKDLENILKYHVVSISVFVVVVVVVILYGNKSWTEEVGFKKYLCFSIW